MIQLLRGDKNEKSIYKLIWEFFSFLILIIFIGWLMDPKNTFTMRNIAGCVISSIIWMFVMYFFEVKSKNKEKV